MQLSQIIYNLLLKRLLGKLKDDVGVTIWFLDQGFKIINW